MFFENYISISSSTQENILKYGNTPILKYTYIYPVFASNSHSISTDRFNKYYERQKTLFLRHVKKDLFPAAMTDYKNSINANQPIQLYEIFHDFTVTYNQNCLVSLYLDQYEFTGGVHGAMLRTSDVWNVKLGKQLSLTDLFTSDIATPNFICNTLITQINESPRKVRDTFFPNYANLISENFKSYQFFLEDEGVAFYFQQYDIAPYMTGLPTFLIPYNRFLMMDCCK